MKARNYDQWRQSVFKRDKYTCVNCGTHDELTADHILPRRLYPQLALEIDNGRTLCTHCHAAIGEKAGRAPHYSGGTLFVSDLKPSIFWPEDLRDHGYIGDLTICDAQWSLVILRPNASTKNILRGLKLLVKKFQLKAELEAREIKGGKHG